jgi:transposase-like protein
MPSLVGTARPRSFRTTVSWAVLGPQVGLPTQSDTRTFPSVRVSRTGFRGDLDSGCCPGERRSSALMARPRKYPQELLDRGARLALESDRPIAHIAADLGINSEVLRKRVRQAEADAGLRKDGRPRSGKRSVGCARKTPSCGARTRSCARPPLFFARGARPRPTEVSGYVDEHRDRFGVEPICSVLGVSVSAYYQRRSGRRSARRV